MAVNAIPDKIREFFKHCAIDGANVVHDWATEAFKHVAAFDYKTASLQKYAPPPVEVPVPVVNNAAGLRCPSARPRRTRGTSRRGLRP